MSSTKAMRGNRRKHESKNPLQKYLIQNFLKEIRLLAGDLRKKKVLEAGCGEGFALKNFMDHGTISAHLSVGVDLDRDCLDFAKNLAPQVAFQAASIYHLPFEDKAFDCTFSLEVLEHLERPEEALRELRRVSKCLIVSVPHEPFFMAANLLRGKNIKAWGNDPEHINHWGVKSFKKLLSGFGRIQTFKTPFPWQAARVEFD